MVCFKIEMGVGYKHNCLKSAKENTFPTPMSSVRIIFAGLSEILITANIGNLKAVTHLTRLCEVDVA